jgi:nucleoside-diphosphate-sugar epimerase
MTERVLLAGCGDLGQRVAERLLARGDEVWALRRRPPGDDGSGIHWLVGDLTQPATLRDLPLGITQLVYSPTPDARDEAAYRAVFGDGLRHLLEAVHGDALKRVLFVSSSAVYGEHGDAWVDAERWLDEQTVPSTSLRLAGLYGPGRLQLIDRLRAGQAHAPRSTSHWSNRIHVDDAAAAIAHLLAQTKLQSLYIGVDDTPLPMHVLYDHLAMLAGAPPPTEGPPPAGIGSKRLSNARLRASGFKCHWPDARDGYAALL